MNNYPLLCSPRPSQLALKSFQLPEALSTLKTSLRPSILPVIVPYGDPLPRYCKTNWLVYSIVIKKN